ncbi:hypothetical protein OHB41_33120 [Streptomyces sp. NBC_01571]|uniref:hypothetical protein n=1 Tax=Streptomyces sp. NBC_01571 TaxID=2975883 RepID=UPI00224F1783|nr:hypothetical protein [Streptomyces sp. NBC_01571]MCX4577943.1 hypothetical protein [Streptomyces sp. NBC_01571]
MSARIKGKSLTLKFEDTDYQADIGSATLNNEDADGDFTTFADAAAGGAVQWFFEGEAVQSTDSASFWSYLWDNTGLEVAYVFAPHGNAVASTTQPHFTGSVRVGRKPSIGGTANETFTFEYRLDCTGEPTKVTTGA